MILNNTNMPNTDTRTLNFNNSDDFVCDGCGCALHSCGDPACDRDNEFNIVPEAGHESNYCPECYTRRVPGTVYDRKGLDAQQLKLDDGLDDETS
jgi:hypothetical protein